jgi:hypothetical protein
VLRKDWKFPYDAQALARATEARLASRDERIVLAHPTPKSRDWERGAKVMVRNDLQEHLEECLQKLRWHTEQPRDCDGRLQALQANPAQRSELDIEDWLHFIGRN